MPAHSSARARRGPQAIVTLAKFAYRDVLARLAERDRLPLFGETSFETRSGFLLAYGADLDDLVRRSALQVGKVLKGARIGELPIERPIKFQLSVNLKTAQSLGLAIPDALLLRADEVIR